MDDQLSKFEPATEYCRSVCYWLTAFSLDTMLESRGVIKQGSSGKHQNSNCRSSTWPSQLPHSNHILGYKLSAGISISGWSTNQLCARLAKWKNCSQIWSANCPSIFHGYVTWRDGWEMQQLIFAYSCQQKLSRKRNKKSQKHRGGRETIWKFWNKSLHFVNSKAASTL